jgi:uncharacterized protein (DUF362 family)
MASVIIERLQPGNYEEDCAALPRDYGTARWEDRPEVQAIRSAVFSALDALNARCGIESRFIGRSVLVKPNLVTVYHEMGLKRRSYPETTDPRVLDATVLWLARVASEIVIVESSGRGAPTRGSFKVSGMDRLARHRGCDLVALDEEPADRYFLPKATVLREILVPRIFSRVVRGEAAYVSVPKLKTNLYTEVTLGFKNAMGVIPYNLRQRDHNYNIDRKLVEMLYLFKPDLVLIDGVVGAEGECPAPVDPVDSRMIIAGDHPVETDRVATRLMGFDPAAIKLMQVADELNFGDPCGVEVIGDQSPLAFRPADASLISERVRRAFPTVTVLIGIDKDLLDKSGIPASAIDPQAVRAIEASCRGGCVATTRFAFAMLAAEGISLKRKLVVIVGAGLKTERCSASEGARDASKSTSEGDCGPHWYDFQGKAYDLDAIKALPGRKMAIGTCSKILAPYVDRHVIGCMPMPNAPHMVLHELSGRPCRVMSFKNRNLIPMLLALLGQRAARRRLIKNGERLDVRLELEENTDEPLQPSPDELSRDWIEWPLPALGDAEKKQLLNFEDDAALAGLRGMLVFRTKEKILWRLQAIVTTIITLIPALCAIVSLTDIQVAGIAWQSWLGLFAGIEAIHALEIPAALKASRGYLERRSLEWTRRAHTKAIIGTLLTGYPSWVPKKLKVFD